MTAYPLCELPQPLLLVLPAQVLLAASKNYPGLPFPDGPQRIEQDFLRQPQGGPLLLVDERQPAKLQFSLCTARYELLCSPAPRGEALVALRLAPLSLRAHNQVARGALRIVPHTWGVFEDLETLTQEVPTAGPLALDQILQAWKSLPRDVRDQPGPIQSSAASPTPDELTFLANIDTLIELSCQVELEQAARAQKTPIKYVESAGAIHRYQVSAPTPYRPGEYLQTGSAGAPGPDAVLVAAGGGSLSLRFLQPLEAARARKLDWVAPKTSTRQYAIQHEAVQALRSGGALNPRLLPLLVENRYEPYKLPSAATQKQKKPGSDPRNLTAGQERPNPAQQNLIERALLVPDLLLALGPPGTGKTDTIREIVARQAALGRKVLVTSRNHKAVDNALAGLEPLGALRIGREEMVDPAVRPLLIDQRAAMLQQDILSACAPLMEKFDDVQDRWPLVQRSIDTLVQLLVDWRQAAAACESATRAFAAWQEAARQRARPALDRLEKRAAASLENASQLSRQAAGLRRRMDVLEPLLRAPLVARIAGAWGQGLASDHEELLRLQVLEEQKARSSRRERARVTRAAQEYATASPEALRERQALSAAEATLTSARLAVEQSLAELARLSARFEGLPKLPECVETPAELQTALQAWRAWYEQAMQRRALLTEWRDLIQNRPDVLHPSLIRGAPVVGATCIGIATDARFEDLEFDLVIADEAGQIQAMDLLVPLVRARRAVLVGDHLQLPPVVETEVLQKINENEPDNPDLAAWLEKSLFERLIERPATPEANRVMLDTQYRMPRQIADFISAQFYDGKYHTCLEITPSGPFFGGSPLVMIDTMREFRHFETRSEDGQGYFNAREAGLICDLLLAYAREDIQPGVIVPYKRQAELIRRELRKRQPELGEDDLATRIATVDSFQGREQDVIIFGFTRSNTEGRIGFLNELRRLNVSLTRARRQLILVGDSTTLSAAEDPQFARLFKSLLEIVRKNPKGYLYASDLTKQLQPQL